MKFIMEIEPHDPNNKNRPCDECVLKHGPMCLDRSYCKFKETGKTWQKQPHNQQINAAQINICPHCDCIGGTHQGDCKIFDNL